MKECMDPTVADVSLRIERYAAEFASRVLSNVKPEQLSELPDDFEGTLAKFATNLATNVVAEVTDVAWDTDKEVKAARALKRRPARRAA